jgi:tetratricopeptide (TPR) repeat protein
VLERLASGGMGTVYRVLDRVAGEERVLKRMQVQEGARARYFLEAFEREYQVLRTLDHPRIIRAFDYGIDDEGPYYTMELLDGNDLRRTAPTPYKTACSRLRDVATSLVLLHARRLLHRDLSPGNVRLTSDGRCKLLDFGALCPFGSSDVIVGTPPLLAPEALAHAPLDERTDLYSLGALAYWMLTGKHAFPAAGLDALAAAWKFAPAPPSSLSAGIPRELDDLVLSLLQRDPRSRPASAAEVIARFTVIGDLSPEDATESARHAMSFLSSPRFVGRAELIARLESATEGTLVGRGGALVVEAIPGMGRSRLLEEIGVHAQLSGMAVVRVDASTTRRTGGTARALALRLLDAVPELATSHAAAFRDTLAALGPDLEQRLAGVSSTSRPPGGRSLDGWIGAIAREKPLLVQIDNVEHADDASLAVLASLAKDSAALPLLLVTTVAEGRNREDVIGLTTLLQRSERQGLRPLTVADVHELTRSLFGDAPKVERFAEWLFDWTAGSPLHALEISRQLLSKEIIRYTAGVWTLPDRPPESGLATALGDVLSARTDSLSSGARILAECLGLQHEQPTLSLCRLLLPEESTETVLSFLDELARRDVLYAERDGYRFGSSALREAILGRMNDLDARENHKRLGDAFLSLAGARGNPELRLQAGWHLIQGEDEARGADTIASVTHDALTGSLIANLHRTGPALEAALSVYDRHRRSVHQRMPLLAALAQAGFYEDRHWGERYGAQALDVLEDLSGLRTARWLRRFVGGHLGLVFGIIAAFIRFQLTPRSERKYSFDKVLIQMFTAVTTLTGAAALSLDAERAACIASVLEPFAVLPQKLTPVGIYQYCRALENIAREREAEAYDTFDVLIRRFGDPRYYPTLPDEARRLYLAGAHFARGAVAIFRADGRGALESADVLDTVGLRLYTMIASQLRWLYYTLRGEFEKALPHRRLVEEHAADVGSVWQVETWQGASLLVVYSSMRDIVSSTRIAEELEAASRTIPSLKPYVRAARINLLLARGEVFDWTPFGRVFADHQRAPREHVGWARLTANVARCHNLRNEHQQAKRVCEHALSSVDDADREYAAHFAPLELELATADAALGCFEEAFARVDALLARFRECDHPLVLGSLHATKAQIAHAAGHVEVYERHLTQAERWFLSTAHPSLVAQCARLRELQSPREIGRTSTFGNLREVNTSTTVIASGAEDDPGKSTEVESATEATATLHLAVGSAERR